MEKIRPATKLIRQMTRPVLLNLITATVSQDCNEELLLPLQLKTSILSVSSTENSVRLTNSYHQIEKRPSKTSGDARFILRPIP